VGRDQKVLQLAHQQSLPVGIGVKELVLSDRTEHQDVSYDDNNSCLQSAGWHKANDRYQFQQRKTEKVPYKLGRVVEFIM